MRPFLVLLLCITLPWQAWAAQSDVPMLCPMGGMMGGMASMTAMAGMEAAATALPDSPASAEQLEKTHSTAASCCNDLATFLQTGQHCNTGQDCTAGPGFFLVPQRATSPGPVVAAGHSEHPSPGLPTSHSLIWRPPTPSA